MATHPRDDDGQQDVASSSVSLAHANRRHTAHLFKQFDGIERALQQWRSAQTLDGDDGN
jgi:hypothetical protein